MRGFLLVLEEIEGRLKATICESLEGRLKRRGERRAVKGLAKVRQW